MCLRRMALRATRSLGVGAAAFVARGVGARADMLHATYRRFVDRPADRRRQRQRDADAEQLRDRRQRQADRPRHARSHARGASTGKGAIVDGHVVARDIRHHRLERLHDAHDPHGARRQRGDRRRHFAALRGQAGPHSLVRQGQARDRRSRRRFVVPAPAKGPLVGPASCDRTIPIFDGYTRFDIDLSYVGQREVSAKGYKGPVAVCAVRYVPIAGHRRDRPATKFMADNKDLEVWLAPIDGARVLMPFRVSVRTMIGTTVIEASEFSVAAK